MSDKIFEPDLLDMADQALKKCKTCQDAKKTESLLNKNIILTGKHRELLHIADKLFFDMKLTYLNRSDYTTSLLDDVVDLSRRKIEDILNNDGKAEDIRKIIVDIELLTGR